MPRRTFGPRLLMLMAVVVMTPAVAFGPLYAVGEFGRVRGISRWPTVPATIVDPPGRSDRGAAGPGESIAYRYDVEGTTYFGRYRPLLAGPRSADPLPPVDPRAIYPPGSEHPVYVNPDDPAESYLEIGPPRVSWPLVVLPPLIALAMWGYLAFAVWPRSPDGVATDGEGPSEAPLSNDADRVTA